MKDLSNEKLLEMLANATKTHYQCHGHGKADRNEQSCVAFKEELTKRGVEIPSDDDLLKVGIFNGEGAQ